MITVVIGAWIGAAVLSWLARRRARRQQAWLRSDVPAKVAYARLREEIDRQAMDNNTNRIEPRISSARLIIVVSRFESDARHSGIRGLAAGSQPANKRS